MRKKKRNKHRKSKGRNSNLPNFGSTQENDFPALSDEAMMKEISEMQKQNPELVQNLFNELNNWREDFFKEHGREPEEEDLTTIFDEDDWDELEGLEDGIEEEMPEICNTCAWCLKKLKEDEERFTFGVKTRIDICPFENPTQPMIMTMADGKKIQAIITALDSPARREGYQLLIMCCSEMCIEAAQEALHEAIEIDKTGMLN